MMSVLQMILQRDTYWTSARFRATQIPNVYPGHYSSAFASSSILSCTSIGFPCGRLAWEDSSESERLQPFHDMRDPGEKIGPSPCLAQIQGLHVPLSEYVASLFGC